MTSRQLARTLAKRRAIAGAAAALSVANPYPGERPAHDPWLNQIEAASGRHWAARNVRVGNVPIDVASSLRDSDAATGDPTARGGGGRIVVNDRYVGQMLRRARNKQRTTRERRMAFQSLGRTIAHEMGHVGGLDHTPSGIMSADADVSAAPWEIVHLSRQLIKRNSRRDARLSRVRGGGMRASG